MNMGSSAFTIHYTVTKIVSLEAELALKLRASYQTKKVKILKWKAVTDDKLTHDQMTKNLGINQIQSIYRQKNNPELK